MSKLPCLRCNTSEVRAHVKERVCVCEWCSSCSVAQIRRTPTLHASVAVCRVSVSFCRDSTTLSSARCQQFWRRRRRRLRWSLAHGGFSSHSVRRRWIRPWLRQDHGLPLLGILSEGTVLLITFYIVCLFGFSLVKFCKYVLFHKQWAVRKVMLIRLRFSLHSVDSILEMIIFCRIRWNFVLYYSCALWYAHTIIFCIDCCFRFRLAWRVFLVLLAFIKFALYTSVLS